MREDRQPRRRRPGTFDDHRTRRKGGRGANGVPRHPDPPDAEGAGMELKPLLIENARLLGGETGRLLAVDGRIAALNPAEPPEGAERIDAKGQCLAPGIIHLGVFATDKPAFPFAGITRAALLPHRDRKSTRLNSSP